MKRQQETLTQEDEAPKMVNLFRGQLDLDRWFPNQKKLFEDGED